MKNRYPKVLHKIILSLMVCSVSTAWAQEDLNSIMLEIETEKKRLDELEQRLRTVMPEGSKESEQVVSTQETEQTGISKALNANNDIVPERIKIDPNESRDSERILTANDLKDDSFKGSWPMFGTDYRMKIGGYFELDMLYDFGGSGDEYQFLINQIPVEGTQEDQRGGYFNMFVRETRFNFDIRNTGQDGVREQFFLEMDFFDLSSSSPRLRHAYVIYGNLLVGQSWSTVVEMSSIPFNIDFAAGDALFGTRTPQIRWQQQVDEQWSWAVGLEQMWSSGIYNPLNLGGQESPQLPVLAGRLTHTTSSGIHSLAALVQQLHWDGEGTTPDATAIGWALIYAGRENINDSNSFLWNLAYGDGTTDGIMALTGSKANAILTDDGQLITRQGYCASLGLVHKWSKEYTSTLSYVWTDLEDIGDRAPDAIQSGDVGHVNLIWSPVANLSTGIEYMWGNKKNSDGAEGDSSRVQTMVKYTF